MAQSDPTPQELPAFLIAKVDQLEAVQAAEGPALSQLLDEVEVARTQQAAYDVRAFSFDEEQALLSDELALAADLDSWPAG